MTGLILSAICLMAPVGGPVTAGYGPVGDYGGHWGVDYAAALETVVRAPTDGTVTFAGSVAGMNTITIQPLDGFKVSVSYLAHISVHSGQVVHRGDRIGLSGSPHGIPGVHMSLRVGGRYVNPAGHIGCRSTDISRALRLITPPGPYARRGANRDSRRDIRSDTHRSSTHW
jgi:murein DD-endopeptidase MepM/ murein hydrolase activator NlpD